MAVAKGKFKLSGPIVDERTKRMTEILARDAGQSVETYLGRIVTTVVADKWREFSSRLLEEETRAVEAVDPK